MSDLDRAIAAARESDAEVVRLGKTNRKSAWLHALTVAYATQCDLLAALDAARGQAVAWVDEFGNAYPLSAYSGKGDWQDDHKRHWRRAYAAPPAAAVTEVEPEGEVPASLWTDEQCREFCRVAFRHRHQPGLPTQTTLDDIRYGAHFAMLAAALAGNKENNNG